MTTETDDSKFPTPNRDRTSAPIGIAAALVGLVAMIPALIGMCVLGAVAFYGVRFVWQMVKLIST